MIGLTLRAFACSLVVSSADAAAEPARPPSLVQAGEGTATATADQGRFRAGVVSVAATVGEALEANAVAMDAVRKAVAAKGVDPGRDVQTVRFYVGDHYVRRLDDSGREVRKKDGFEVVHMVVVLVRDLADLGKVLDGVVHAGANEVDSISFESSHAGERQDEARAGAVKDARRRADLIASALGCRLGPVIEAAESVALDRPAYLVESSAMARAAESATTEVSGGSLEYHARVSVKWALVEAAP